MKRRYAAMLELVVLFLLLGSICWAQDGGSLRGIVLDERGAPISGAKVNASPIDGRPLMRLVRYVETDSDGRFFIDRLEWGDYGVFAMKEESGYADMGASLYSSDIFPRITLSPASPSLDVRIQIGPRAGAVTGSVRNVVTGEPLNARFKLTRATSPDKWLSTSVPPNYRILIPSSTDVLLEVSAPGYRAWSPGYPLRLQPGAELHLDIDLDPFRDPNLHPSKFLVPKGYVGWLLLEFKVPGTQSVESEEGVFKFPPNGVLITSSAGPERGAEDVYFYYSDDGSLQEIPRDYRDKKGMVWGQHEGTTNGIINQFGFFVGSEEQYKKFQNRVIHPGPIVVQ